MERVVNGILTEVFEKGWWGSKNEGVEFLDSVALPVDKIPFDIVKYLSGEMVTLTCPEKHFNISFTNNDFRMEFALVDDVNENGRNFYLYHEWNDENSSMVSYLESYAAGESTRNLLAHRSLII